MAVGRFLEQSTYGPTPALMDHVKQIGTSAFIDEQFAMPESPWPPFSAKLPDVVDAFFANALSGQDQLRQRVVGPLSEIIVISRTKNNTSSSEIIPWLQLLSRNAFGNYRTLLGRSPSTPRWASTSISPTAGPPARPTRTTPAS